uniref:Kynurenine aminotransferase 1 n=1 Tax=Crocodylus porosus TaxID=8502 RepID=A0A7M4E2H9_CROPO
MSRSVQAQRLQGLDKNVWVEFVKLAATYPTVNLGQGFPDFPPPDFVKEAFVKAVSGENAMLHQYTRVFGHPALVTILARFFGKLLGQDIDPLTNVMVTVGAYEALFCCFQALVDGGDEVIIIEPFFDCYEPMVKMAGGTPVFIPLRPVSGPQIPLSRQEAVAQGFQRELERYGKPESYFVQLPQELQQKRDWLVQSLLAVGMKPIIPEGTYFLIADLSEFKAEVPDLPDCEEPYDSRFVKWMIKNKGLAAIPVSAFYSTAQKRNFDHFIRFCFVKVRCLGEPTSDKWGQGTDCSSEEVNTRQGRARLQRGPSVLS